MRKLIGLQYLRGLAACSVVIFHAAGRIGWKFHAGEAGVDLFFLLSGFLMVTITDANTCSLKFLADRARRIVPIYWIATSVMLGGCLAHVFPNRQLDVAHVIASYFFLPWRPPGSIHAWPLIVAGWTLNYEMMFYVVFAALIQFCRQTRQIVILTIFFSVLVLFGLLVKPQNVVLYTYTDPIVLEFVGGCWLATLWKRHDAWPLWLGWGTALVALAMVELAAVFAPQTHRVLGFGIPAALLFSSVLALERRSAIRVWRVPLFLGDASFSIYIWHTLAISVVLAIARWLGLSPIATVAVTAAGGTFVGIIGYLVLERPIMAWFRKRRRASALSANMA